MANNNEVIPDYLSSLYDDDGIYIGIRESQRRQNKAHAVIEARRRKEQSLQEVSAIPKPAPPEAQNPINPTPNPEGQPKPAPFDPLNTGRYESDRINQAYQRLQHAQAALRNTRGVAGAGRNTTPQQALGLQSAQDDVNDAQGQVNLAASAVAAQDTEELKTAPIEPLSDAPLNVDNPLADQGYKPVRLTDLDIVDGDNLSKNKEFGYSHRNKAGILEDY